ncbi:hypothetical protein HPB52_003326 [Rhipicephalus sanguineus]|uniref:Uncharacterized protein n=1 Tax=Rhipicephalus sanguineus TaxID=34632 RepID=A0A9D4PF43_RHISA|nr:hypothetical protein HPB52_003326 [Rhipicephalus sanguineus]
MGGFSIPDFEIMCRVLALRSTWELISDVTYRGRELTKYLLGTSRRFFGLADETGPAAEQPPAYYTKCRRRRRRSMITTSLPAEVRDFTWLREWQALPTADRLAASIWKVYD